MLKTGLKTTELWVTVGISLLKMFWKDFPDDAFLAVFAWASARAGQKFFGLADPSGKPGWKTSEFWVAILYAILTSIFPDIPKESLVSVVGYIVTRTGLKMRLASTQNTTVVTETPTK
jgi:hypothetical protein